MLFLKTGRARISLMRFTFLDNSSRLPFSFPEFLILFQMHHKNFMVCPAEGFNPNYSAFRRREFIGSEFWDTQPWTFFTQNSKCSLGTFFSRPPAEVTSHHQHVDVGKDCHNCNCFQTRNHDTRDDADDYTTIFFILPSIDKGFC